MFSGQRELKIGLIKEVRNSISFCFLKKEGFFLSQELIEERESNDRKNNIKKYLINCDTHLTCSLFLYSGMTIPDEDSEASQTSKYCLVAIGRLQVCMSDAS